jgi:hypothetical protein
MEPVGPDVGTPATNLPPPRKGSELGLTDAAILGVRLLLVGTCKRLLKGGAASVNLRTDHWCYRLALRYNPL